MKISSKDRKRFRVRNKLKKSAGLDRFRLSVFRSAKNISAQIIDDFNNTTLLSVSSVEKDIKSHKKSNKRFEERFKFIEESCEKQGRSVDGLSLSEQDDLWEKAKLENN